MSTEAFHDAAADLHVGVEPAALEVEPGGSATATVWVEARGGGPVDAVIEVLGPSASWFTVTPGRVRAVPGDVAQATIEVRVPAQHLVAPGPIVVGVRASAPGAGVLPHVGELAVRVRVTAEIRLDVVPVIQRVSGRARFAAVVRNAGTAPVRVHLEPGDLAPEVQMRVRPAVVDVAPRARARARVVVRAPAPWTGEEPDRHCTVVALAGDEQVEAPMSFVQRTRLGTALLLLAGLLVLLAVLALVVLVRDLAAPAAAVAVIAPRFIPTATYLPARSRL